MYINYYTVNFKKKVKLYIMYNCTCVIFLYNKIKGTYNKSFTRLVSVLSSLI